MLSLELSDFLSLSRLMGIIHGTILQFKSVFLIIGLAAAWLSSILISVSESCLSTPQQGPYFWSYQTSKSTIHPPQSRVVFKGLFQDGDIILLSDIIFLKVSFSAAMIFFQSV